MSARSPMAWVGGWGGLLWSATVSTVVAAAVHHVDPEASILVAGIAGAILGALVSPLDLAGARGGVARMGRHALGGLLVGVDAALVLLLVRLTGDAGAGAAWLLFLGVVAALARPGVLSRLWRLVRVEWRKTWHMALVRYGLLGCALVTLLAGWMQDPLPEESGWALGVQAQGTGLWAAEVLLLVLGATTLAGEMAQGTLKMILPHAYKRAEWVAAKALVLVLVAALFAAVVGGTAWLHADLAHGLDDIVKEYPPGFGEETGRSEVFQPAATMRSHWLDALSLGALGLATSALLGLLFSSLFSTVVPALSSTFLLFLGLESADVLLGLPPRVMQHVYATAPETLRAWTQKLGRGLNEVWDEALWGQGAWVAILTGALAWLVALRVFDRRDLHG